MGYFVSYICSHLFSLKPNQRWSSYRCHYHGTWHSYLSISSYLGHLLLSFNCCHTSASMVSVLVVATPTNNRSIQLKPIGWSMPLWLTVSIIFRHRSRHNKPVYRSVNTCQAMLLENCCLPQDEVYSSKRLSFCPAPTHWPVWLG